MFWTSLVVLFLLAIVFSVLLRFTHSDYPFGSNSSSMLDFDQKEIHMIAKPEEYQKHSQKVTLKLIKICQYLL
jgi:hypothetical protein